MKQTLTLNRRAFLGASAASIVGLHTLAATRDLKFTAVGQALILLDVRPPAYQGYAGVRERIRRADLAFTNLEVSIKGAGVEMPNDPNRPASSKVGTAPVVLDALKEMGFGLLSLSNNHADDLGAPGILSTIDETKRRGFGYAGTGRNLAEAAAPGYLATPQGKVALVAKASSSLPPESFATATRTGINHLAQKDGVVDPGDAERILASIKEAAKGADHVFVYHHDHYWAPDWQDTPDWKKQWCRACIDAGATAFISHGVPVIHGIEIYRGRPIFYGLGNFIFHLSHHLKGEIPKQFQQTAVWQSVIAECQFRRGQIASIRLDPIALKQDKAAPGSYQLDGNPRLVKGAEATEILTRLQTLSQKVGTKIEIKGDYAEVKL